jgi:hypothetical protein
LFSLEKINKEVMNAFNDKALTLRREIVANLKEKDKIKLFTRKDEQKSSKTYKI